MYFSKFYLIFDMISFPINYSSFTIECDFSVVINRQSPYQTKALQTWQHHDQVHQAVEVQLLEAVEAVRDLLGVVVHVHVQDQDHGQVEEVDQEVVHVQLQSHPQNHHDHLSDADHLVDHANLSHHHYHHLNQQEFM